MANVLRKILRTTSIPVRIVVVLFMVSVCLAKMSSEQLKVFDTEENVKNFLKNQLKLSQEHIKKDGAKKHSKVDLTSTETKADKNISLPRFKPGILQEIQYSYRRYREMLILKAGSYWMGTNNPDSLTGEYPLHYVTVQEFYIDVFPVINADYWAFRAKKKFVRSEAERKGWSWVVDMFLSSETREYYSLPGALGWAAVKKAHWDAPEGPGTDLTGRWKHPVVHLSWQDAKQYCEFHGKRLPTEMEWEYAARAGVLNHAYPWGDQWERHRANVWQGTWPGENTKVDGYVMTSPVDAYKPQNSIGMYDMIGNVWEWTSSAYTERMVRPHIQSKMAVLRGGSYVDSVSGKINAAVRNGQRMGQKLDYTAANVGFRCAKTAIHHNVGKEAKKTRQPKGKKKKRVFHRKPKDEL